MAEVWSLTIESFPGSGTRCGQQGLAWVVRSPGGCRSRQVQSWRRTATMKRCMTEALPVKDEPALGLVGGSDQGELRIAKISEGEAGSVDGAWFG